MLDYYRKYFKKESGSTLPVIKFRTNFTNCILEVLRKRGYKQTDGDDWDLYWSEKDNIADIYQTKRLLPQQKINHYRNFSEVCRKDLLVRNLKKYKKWLERQGRLEQSQQYNFFPMTYILPSEYVIFADEFKKQQGDKNVWIMKPIARSQGKGIFLFNKLSSVSSWQNHAAENYIVQKYIADPLLIGGKKFDMRIYVLVTSFSPLTIFLYRSGFARFTHYRYEDGKLNQTEIHLTNVAVQKQTDNYDENLGGKWMLNKMRLFLMAKYGHDKINVCFGKIQDLIIRTLEAVQKVMNTDRNHSFELYGFDVLLDSQFQPWLLEINSSPSMTASTPNDYELKMGVLDDTLTVVDLDLTEKEEQIGGFDLIYKGAPVKLPGPTTNTSFLGTFNNRLQSIKKLAKISASRMNQPTAERTKEADKKGMNTCVTANSSQSRRVTRKVLGQAGQGASSNGRKEFQIKTRTKKENENYEI